jgi:hypothetical protein
VFVVVVGHEEESKGTTGGKAVVVVVEGRGQCRFDGPIAGEAVAIPLSEMGGRSREAQQLWVAQSA